MDPYQLNRPLIMPAVTPLPTILDPETMLREISWSEGDWVRAMIAYGKNPGTNVNLDFIKAQVGKIVDSEPSTFLQLIKSPDYKYKIFLRKLIDKGIVRENGGKYTLVGGEVLGFSFDQAIDFCLKPENQEVLVSLKGQLQAAK